MTLETVTPAVIAAAILAGLLEWFPKLAEKWALLSPAKKVTINALLVALISILSVVGGCYWWGNVCPEGGLWSTVSDILIVFILSFTGNQSIHRGIAKRELWGRGFRAPVKSVPY